MELHQARLHISAFEFEHWVERGTYKLLCSAAVLVGSLGILYLYPHVLLHNKAAAVAIICQMSECIHV